MHDNPTRIYLTGFMGSGKTTVGRILANSIDYRFVDLDDAIESRAGRSIPRIFEMDGEGAFRDLERTALEETLAMDHLVVATGGGALTMRDAMDLAKSAGLVVYLAASPETIVARTQAESATRPLLSPHANDLLTHVSSLLEQRLPHYRRAHLTVAVDDLDPQMIVREIRRGLREQV